MSTRLRLGTILVLAITPSACSVLAGLDGLTGGGGADGGDETIVPDAPDAPAQETGGPDVEGGAPDGDASGMDARTEEAASMQDVTSQDVLTDAVSEPAEAESGALAYFQVVAADSPKAYWRLDEPVGSTTAKDLTGNGNDGTYVGGVTLAQPGAIANDADTSATFDGTTGYVDVGTAFPFAGMTAFTLEAWVKAPIDTANYHCWISRNDANMGPSEGYLAFTDPSGPYYAFQRVDLGTKITATNNTVATTAWTHLVVTYQPGTGSTVYVNAQPSPTTTNDVTIGTVTSHFVIGAEFGGVNSWWAGGIDEVAVYDYPLSPTRIQVHYNVGSGH